MKRANGNNLSSWMCCRFLASWLR